jgi:hypothetical protein
MSGADVVQFLDLIAENAQIKAEILALKQFSSSVHLFDQAVIRSCIDEFLGEDQKEDFAPI